MYMYQTQYRNHAKHSKSPPWDSHRSKTVGVIQEAKRKYSTLAQIWFLSAATAKAFTTVFAGFAFTFCSTPNIILTPAFVAGFTLVLMRATPGMVKIPVFFTSFVAMAARDSKTTEHSFVFKPCSSAIAFTMAPFVMAL